MRGRSLCNDQWTDGEATGMDRTGPEHPTTGARAGNWGPNGPINSTNAAASAHSSTVPEVRVSHSQVSGSLKPTSPHSHTQPAQRGSGTRLPAHGGPCGGDRDTCIKIMPSLSPKGRAGRDLSPNHAPVENVQGWDTNMPEGGGENVPGKNAPVCYLGFPAWDAAMKPAWLPSHGCFPPTGRRLLTPR